MTGLAVVLACGNHLQYQRRFTGTEQLTVLTPRAAAVHWISTRCGPLSEAFTRLQSPPHDQIQRIRATKEQFVNPLPGVFLLNATVRGPCVLRWSSATRLEIGPRQ